MVARDTLVVVATLLAGVAVVLAAATGMWGPAPEGPDQPGTGTATAGGNATVTLVDDNGTTLATVAVRIADDGSERHTGLSDTASLAPGNGMLFVHRREAVYAYVMRDMAFPLDIVFVDANGTITAIHHAPVEPGQRLDQLTRYEGRGKYVLEVPRGYTNETGVDVGDRLVLPDGVA